MPGSLKVHFCKVESTRMVNLSVCMQKSYIKWVSCKTVECSPHNQRGKSQAKLAAAEMCSHVPFMIISSIFFFYLKAVANSSRTVAPREKGLINLFLPCPHFPNLKGHPIAPRKKGKIQVSFHRLEFSRSR